MTTESRFWAKVDKNGPVPAHCPELGCCWLWKGAGGRYGHLRVGSKRDGTSRMVLAHRISYALEEGVSEESLENVLHHCDNTRCVRRTHLFEGSHSDNMRDRSAKGRMNAAEGERNGMRKHPERVPRGENHGRSKLTDEERRTIRTQRARDVPARVLAKRYHVSTVTIYNTERGAP